MNDAEANRALVQAVPEAEFEYRSLKRLFGAEEPGATVVYENALKPVLVKLARTGTDADLRRVFHFLESLSAGADSWAQDLVAYSVYDLCQDSEALKRARPHIGPETARICDRVVSEELA